MPIDINGLPPAAAPAGGDKSRVKQDAQATESAPARAHEPAQKDTVHLTDAATRLAELDRALASVPVVDAKRVEEIKLAVADGRYQPDPASVANKLFAFENALPKPKG